MRGGSGLALAYVLGLVALAATRRREGLQRVLVRAKLLLPRVGPVPITQLQRWANVGNGALLLMSAPLQWRATDGLLNAAALRSLVLSGWLSLCGVLLVMREMPLAFMRRWLRRHVRFATTTSGRSTVHLFAATLALSSGTGVGVAVGPQCTLLGASGGRDMCQTACIC